MIKQFFKKVLIIYLVVIACVFTPTYRAYAVSAGGWAFSSFDVAKSVVTAMKNGASASVAVAKSPITTKIAKGIVGGAIAGAAIPLAISQLSGIALQSVDWVLDPANNAVKYKDKDAPAGLVFCDWYDNCDNDIYLYSTPQAAATKTCQNYSQTFVRIIEKAPYKNGQYLTVECKGKDGTFETWNIIAKLATGTGDYKTVSIPTLSSKIYDNAKTDSESRSIVNDAVKDYVNEGSADSALDAAKADADASHACGTGTHWSGSACVADTPSTPTTPTTPDTPFDPTSIIDAIGRVFDAVMSLPDVINNALDDLLNDIKDFFQPVIDSFTDFVDWVKAEPTPENPTQPDVTTLPTPQTDSVNISFDGGCPAPNVIPWSLAGQNVDITISYTPICDTATLLNPIIKLAASLGAVFIIAGIRRGDDG